MNAFRIFAFSLLSFAALARAAEEIIDRVDEALTRSAFDDQVRVRLSGTLDLEAYHFDQPAPGLIDSQHDTLFNPRFTLFLDAQLGPRVYAFAQARVDRGFDPSDGGTQVRLAEYAIRITPWEDGRFNFQIGQFSTVVGNWVARHLSWDNPFINSPLPYENVTGIEDIAAPLSGRDLAEPFSPKEKYEYNPILWGPNYTTGASVAGRLGKFDYALEMKNAALTSRPETWNATEGGLGHPTFSGRVGYRPNEAWNLGFSASRGAYLRPQAEPTLPRGRGLGDYHELVLGQDIGFAWHHLQLWAEFYEARFEVPRVGNADTFAYYFEAKYKFTPQLFGALRWNEQLFGTVREDGGGGRIPWSRDAWRIDSALGYRITPHTQLKLQYNLGRDDSGRSGFGHMLAAQFTLRF